jgi:uncharacterized protein (TIGR02145 family)
MDRNLGASRAATSSNDSLAYGDLFQWGRGADGHQKRNSQSTTTFSIVDWPGHGSLILPPGGPWDWRVPQNDNLWQGVNGINNPCPTGYRIPTGTEWDAEIASWGSNDSAGAFATQLKLPLGGIRQTGTAEVWGVGSNGGYWSGSVFGTSARHLSFGSSSAVLRSDNRRARGRSVRCIKD